MSSVFLEIVNMSISASWIVLAVLLLRLLLKKAPKWIAVLLWGIVAIRLICPISIESVMSLIPSSETISEDIMMEHKPAIDTGVPVINNVVNPVIEGSFSPVPEASVNPLQIIISIATVVWMVGIAAMLMYTVISYLQVKGKIGTAILLRDNIFQSESVVSPFVLGIIRPRIYLPFHLNEQDMEHVIGHENAHIRRKDHLWKPVGFLLLTIHWFNPFIWLGYVLLCRDIELACDEKVVKEFDNQKKADYAQALLTCSVNRRMIAACPLAFGEVGVKDRVKSVLNYKKPAFWIIMVAILASIIVAVCFLTDPVSKDKPEKSETVSGSEVETENKEEASETEGVADTEAESETEVASEIEAESESEVESESEAESETESENANKNETSSKNEVVSGNKNPSQKEENKKEEKPQDTGKQESSESTVVVNGDYEVIGDVLYVNSEKVTNEQIKEVMNSGIKKVVVTSNVSHIKERLFESCHDFNNIIISEGVTSIGENAFNNCTHLEEITIPKTVKSIEKNAFSSCIYLRNVTIPNGVTTIKQDTFLGCFSLEKVVIPSSVTTIERYAFSSCRSLKNISIPDSVTKIGDCAFDSCWELKEIKIPSNVKTIEDGMFVGCMNLTTVSIPNGVTSIGNSAFSHCDKLTSIVIPNTVTSIESNAFCFCKSLTSITIPNSVTSIAEDAFSYCDKLTTIIGDTGSYAEAYAKENGYIFVET